MNDRVLLADAWERFRRRNKPILIRQIMKNEEFQMFYSPSECVKNAYSLFLTKLFYPTARLIRRPFYLRGKGKMVIGKGFTVGYGCRFELLSSEKKETLFFGTNCKLGDRVHIAALEKVTVGDDCLMASNIYISDTNHGTGNDSPLTPPDKRPLTASPVSIGKCVWIGEGVSILPGSKIGDGCILGAHSVVKGEIPPYSIAVGAPARVVKQYDFEKNKWEKVL